MRLDKADPKLMDYVLGELDTEEAEALATALQKEENKDAKALVEELRGVAETTRRILHEDDGEPALSDLQRATIFGQVEETLENVVAGPARWGRVSTWLTVAAAISVVAALGFSNVVYNYAPLGMKMAADSPPPRLPGDEVGQRLRRRYIQSEHKLPRLSNESAVPGGSVLVSPSPEPAPAETPAKPIRSGFEIHDLTMTYGTDNLYAKETEVATKTSPPAAADALLEFGIESGEPQSIELGSRYLLQERTDIAGQNGPTLDGVGVPNVEQRTRLGTKADFTDDVSVYIEFDGYNNWGETFNVDVPANLPMRTPALEEEDGDGLDVGNMSRKAKLSKRIIPKDVVIDAETARQLESLGYLDDSRSLGDKVASKLPTDWTPLVDVTIPFNNGQWQWNTPDTKNTQIVGGPGSETYVKVTGVKPFSEVKAEPLSTFSIDVGTAAYSNVRRFLTNGHMPPADAVRIEEMLNYFDYDYPQPTDHHPFAVVVHGAPAPWDQNHRLVRIGVKGKEVAREERPPANLVFLLDVSGSMGDANKLPLVKESMKTLLINLTPRDRVGIVTYAGNARKVLDLTPCSERSVIAQAIEGLRSGGSTNGGGGIQMAYDMAQSAYNPEGINRVILATDGDFNVGNTSHGGLMGMIEARAKSGVFLTALGFGMGNLKDSTLEQLADRGNGNYAYIDTHAEARKALGRQLSGTLYTIAKDVKIQVEFNPNRISHYRLLGYENRALAARDFNDDTKDAGEIGAGHTVTALYEIIPRGTGPMPLGVDPLKYSETGTPGDTLQSGPEVALPAGPYLVGEDGVAIPDPAYEWLTVKMRYKQPTGSKSTKLEVPLLHISGDLRETDADFRFAAAVAAFGQVLRNPGYRHPGNFDRILDLARPATKGDADREAFLDLVITAKTLSN